MRGGASTGFGQVRLVRSGDGGLAAQSDYQPTAKHPLTDRRSARFVLRRQIVIRPDKKINRRKWRIIPGPFMVISGQAARST
jgi:hypothetical protein